MSQLYRLLFVNRVYPPQSGATGQLLADLAESLPAGGWHARVLASRTVPDLSVQERRNAVVISRASSLSLSRSSLFKRMLSYLSLYPAFLLCALRAPRSEILVTLTDPPLLLLLGPLLKWTKRCRLIHWAQDLYPEVAEELGVLSPNSLPARTLRWASTWALRRHNLIVAVGSCMKERLLARGIPSEQIVVIPNWNLSSAEVPAAGTSDESSSEDSGFRKERGWNDRFVVMYSGNFGLAHPFEAIVDAAKKLDSTGSRALFVFVGEGAGLAGVKEALRGASNVQWLPYQPIEKLGASLRAADVHLASMHERTLGLVVPSKVYGIIAAERPCVFLGPAQSEVARLISENGCGVVLPSGDAPGLARVIQQLADDPVRVSEMRRAAAALGPRVSRDAAVAAWQAVLEQVVGEPRMKPTPAPNASHEGAKVTKLSGGDRDAEM
ncbi:MAG: glycosyltransferase family 4 protein [Verrucomicrobiales bacterium]|nr:glycosyltransferase family 4 protein [Verrucomicrobiales bacterium]